MISSNSFDEPSNECWKDNIKHEKATTNHRQAYRHMDHYLEHVIHVHDSLKQKLRLLISQLSADAISNLSKPIHEFQMKSDEIVKTANIIQQQLKNRITQDPKKPLITMTNELKFDQHTSFEDNIERLEKDIAELKSKLEEINNGSQQRTLQEQNPVPSGRKYSLRSIAGNLSDSMTLKADDTSALSYLLFEQSNPSMLDRNENELVPTGVETKTNLEEEEDAIVVIDSNTTPEISKKIHLSNNIVRWLRGPSKLIVNGIMHTFDICAQGTHISNTVLETVEQRIAQQKQITNNSLKSAFTEITSDWTPDGENSNKGFSSSTSWMHDPQGRRLLVKTQELPFGAVNEWLAYVLGNQLGLPVNEVQISVYQNNLVTLHTDITQEDEKTITLLELTKEKRDKLMTNPIMESMDILDHILQNVDRNLRNILVTIPKTGDINDDNLAVKIRLIDHSSCFGMGKLNFISIVAAKFHSDHLSVVKFDPIHKARQFEQYLNKVPIADRTLISETLNRFADITDDQLDTWITEMQDLLSSSQYNRIHNVLRRQRDIARRYTIQWGICPRSPNVKPNETNQLTSKMNDTMIDS